MIDLEAYVRVGIAGHRLLDGPERLARGVRRALNEIFARHVPREPWFLTSLAEGADQLVIDTLGAGAIYSAILPLPLEEYRRTFKSDAARRHLDDLLRRARSVTMPPETPAADDDFERANNYILANADVVMVLWDGQPARGKGGTGEFVATARLLGRPLAWVHAARDAQHLDEPPVTFERF